MVGTHGPCVRRPAYSRGDGARVGDCVFTFDNQLITIARSADARAVRPYLATLQVPPRVRFIRHSLLRVGI
jgi:hypothetical protein